MSASIRPISGVAVPGALGVARAAPGRLWGTGIVAALAWSAVAALTAFWPDVDDIDGTQALVIATLTVAIFVLVAVGLRAVTRRDFSALRRLGPWLIALAVLIAAWEIITAKLALLPRPFFAAPQSMLQVYADDWPRLGQSVISSLLLLLPGYALGVALGFLVGVSVGWSRSVGYWVHPVLRLVGPLPATAWIPIAFFAFPTSRSASTFLIVLATGFPVAVLTWSGVAAVSSAYYDVARTMGARQWFLIRKVAVPAAMPSVFVGMFMGLGSSFSVLVVAEMLGVKSGLGWYLQWSQGWAAYANMYAALLVMALMCSTLIAILFLVRDRLLSWQRGLVRW